MVTKARGLLASRIGYAEKDDDGTVIVAEGSLEFINGKSSIWSPGAVHIIGDTLRIGGYTFKTDEADPLVFKVSASKGYVYVKGTGSVTDPSGKSTVLPTPVATPQTPFADWTQRQKDEGMIKAVATRRRK